MKTIFVSLRKKIDDSYDVIFKTDYLKRLFIDLKKEKWGNKIAIISDSNVKKLYGDALVKKLKAAGFNAEIHSFQYGERNKTIKTAERLIGSLSKSLFSRDDMIIALGGGVTGDVASFVASVYMRGINYIQIPTTLLSMIDSSAGGKTGVDTGFGKNIIGTFYQPKKVYINVDFLKTLPKKQLLNGIAEAIKYGVIADKKILKFLLARKKKIDALNAPTLEKLAAMCIKIKARIVELDERESDLRKMLNYGHTFGHAIEKMSNFKIQHGEGIAIGMMMINSIAVDKKWLKKKHADKIKSLIKLYGLPTKYPGLKCKLLTETIKLDKKVKDGKVLFIVPYKVGKVLLTEKITNSDILKACKKHS